MQNDPRMSDSANHSRTESNSIAISTLRRRRGNIQGHITAFNKYLEQCQTTQIDVHLLQVSLESLQEYWKKFDDVQSDIEALDSNEEPRRYEITNTYLRAVARARKLLCETVSPAAQAPPVVQSPSPTVSSSISVRLPEIKLPMFNGSYENWNTFYDQFCSIIDRNEDLSPTQKLQYLRSALSGKAATCIESLATTDASYTDAMELLKNKFDCTRKILLNHFDAIREFPKPARETSESLGALVDLANQHLRSLKNLGQPITSWDTPLISIMLSKISDETAWQWELTLKDKKMPSYTHLLEFLEKRSTYTPKDPRKASPPVNDSQKHNKSNITKRQTFLTHAIQCPVCKEAHNIWYCEAFKTLSPEDRLITIKRTSLCSNCLREGHSYANCKSSSCRVCGKKHHTLLHRPTTSGQNRSSNNASTITTENSKQSAFVIDAARNQLLVTAQVDVYDNNYKRIRGRALVDTCATTNFMTEGFARKLKLPLKKCSVPINALNALNTVSRHTVTATINSRINNYRKTLTFLTIPTISSMLPDQPIDKSKIQIPNNIKLADPNFHCPAHVDILLSAGTALSLLCVGQINLTSPGDPDLFLQKTRLGWVIGGSAPIGKPSQPRVCHITTCVPDISKFWEIEETPQEQQLSNEEIACENHFKSHTTRNNEGRYIVALPFNPQKPKLGESHTQALKRLLQLENKLQRNADLKQQYHSVLNEYIELGHMTPVKEKERSHEGFYLPHHGVQKISSLTTGLRVVFDGSARTSTGLSLNDTLYVGPKIQNDIVHILLRFRVHKHVLTGDIEKMYRQFLVRPEDRKYQQILWRDGGGKIVTHQLNTVTFGLAPAPYLAIKCLHQLADDEAHRFPNTAKILKQDFYVDDLLTGFSTIEEGRSIQQELKKHLLTAGLNIRQWASDKKELLEGLPMDDVNKQLQLGETTTLKTLGIMWNSATDTIHYTVKTKSMPSHISKRLICSEIAKIYDPLGLLGPVIITAKIILQKIWCQKIDWDESLPADIHTEWINYYNSLPLLNNIAFPRCTIVNPAKRIQIHGFCDASLKGYGACIYLRSINQQSQVKIQLLMAKSKVAPLKQQTIPRLELCGALLLAKLTTTVQRALHININDIILWTDSTIVLHWIHTSSHLLKTFVANRISEIQNLTQSAKWYHVGTNDNPADLISRGTKPENFIHCSIWKTGPIWLKDEESEWPEQPLLTIKELPEQRTQACLITSQSSIDPYTQFSSWTRLQRIIVYCFRWRYRNQRQNHISVEELLKSRHAILKHLQHTYFKEEIHCLTGGRNITTNSKLLSLRPFLDKDGILRVGGRLKNSTLPFAQKHPIILPKSHIATLIIRNEHLLHLHAGVQTTLYAVRQTYWPINGRSIVWKTIKSCVTCCRYKPPPVEYIMGDLPEARVTESRPFTHVGIDFCGPFYIKERRHRNRMKIKTYVAVFVCMAVKAIHLEVVSDLTTDGFIGALRRFIARRGLCTDIYTDNGSNFIGAKNELSELSDIFNQENHQRIQDFLSGRSISWHFIPPHAPHFGGLWESAVKSFKHHLRRVAGTSLFTFENFNSLVIEIESILNSRPLTPLSSDPLDMAVLTPGHFLIGDAITSLPDRDYRKIPANRLSCWQHIQNLKQHFWTRWHREYLNELTQRHKWAKGTHSIKEGAMVLIREDNAPPSLWALGRISQIHPGPDGIIRTATIKTAINTVVRSVKKLVHLPITEDNAEDSTTHD